MTPSPPPPAIRLRALTKRFSSGVVALQALELEVAQAEIVAVIGASGCGKSTLLRVIAGLDRAHEGTVEVAGVPVAGPGPDRGVVFQEHRLLPWLTAEQNVAFGVAHLAPQVRRQVVTAHLELVGLRGFERSFPHELSGGMAQRVAIARALAPRPSVLLLDEPFGALDAFTRLHLQDEVLRLWAAQRTTLVIVTHDIDEAIVFGDRVVVMNSRPGTVRRVFGVELPRPRERTSWAFAALRKAIHDEFFHSRADTADFSI